MVIVLVSMVQKSGTGDNNFVKWKETGKSGPPSKLVPNIPVKRNRNGPFHLLYQSKIREFWVEWKAPIDSTFGDWHTVPVSKVDDAVMSFGSLSNYHDDGNKNIKKEVTLISKATTLHEHHGFWYTSETSKARPRSETNS